jgi:aryl-alcohol dehydrogenase-like predicted oxidoreductase
MTGGGPAVTDDQQGEASWNARNSQRPSSAPPARITRVGFGAWAIGGGGWEFGQDDEQSVAAIQHALEHGVNWIDTAAAYGLGRSERVVGRALDGVSDRPYGFTKCSLLKGLGRRVVNSLRRDSIMREAHASLGRLGIDAIDLYQIHWPIPETDIEEGWAALAELKEEGLVRHIGVSNFDVEQLRRIQQIAPVETLQPQYSLVVREIEHDVLPFCEREGIGVIAYSPMSSGLLTGKITRERIENLPGDDWRRNDERFQEPQLSRHLALVERLRSVAERHDTTPGAIAVAWTLRNPAVDGAIVGFRRPDQVDAILVAADLELSDDDVAPRCPAASPRPRPARSRSWSAARRPRCGRSSRCSTSSASRSATSATTATACCSSWPSTSASRLRRWPSAKGCWPSAAGSTRSSPPG